MYVFKGPFSIGKFSNECLKFAYYIVGKVQQYHRLSLFEMTLLLLAFFLSLLHKQSESNFHSLSIPCLLDVFMFTPPRVISACALEQLDEE